jgi:iron complex outermembrane recepter protein
MNIRSSAWLLFGSGFLTFSTPVLAQSSEAGSTSAEEKTKESDAAPQETVIVTGTLLRGIAPVGAASIGVSEEDIAATGAQSIGQLLNTIPQVANFNQMSVPGSAIVGTQGAETAINQHIQVARPVLRDLLQTGAIGSTVTLILLDGHRIVPAGTDGGGPDPDVIPPGALERMEIVLDGGSSLYGADAVGGVINFITKRRFEGVEVSGRYGFADDYDAYDANVTAGTIWGNGGVYVSYNYANNADLYGIDRDYIQALNWSTGVPSGRGCDQANVSVGTRNYATPTLAPGTLNACDITDYTAVVPQEARHTVFASLNQEISESIEFDTKAFFTKRDTDANSGPIVTNVRVAPSNPFYRNLAGVDAGATQVVNFNYAPIRGNLGEWRTTEIEEWGITPTATFRVGRDWEVRTMVNYGESVTSYRNQEFNVALQQQYASGTTTSTAINPYDIAATPNQQLIQNILDWQDYGMAESELFNVRAVVDGPLFELPAGEVRAAAGAEYVAEDYRRRIGLTVLGGEDTLPWRAGSRNVKAFFGEVFVPVISDEMTVPAVHSLELSASVRRDDYSDFGNTTNPKFGVTYEPLEWLRLRGNWSESFNAPTISNQLGSQQNSITPTNAFIVVPPGGPPAPPGSFNLTLLGSLPDLQPQTATSWSVGLDLLPTLIDGFRVSMNYYTVEFEGQLARPPIFDATQLFRDFAEYTILFPTRAQIEEAGNSVPGGAALVAPFLAPGGPLVYELLDYRLRNLGNTRVEGLDFLVRYDRPTGFGSIDMQVSGNYQLDREYAPSPTAAYIEIDLDQQNRFKAVTAFGANVGDLRAQVRWNHVEGYEVTRSATLLQDEVGAFDTVDLYFRYDLGAMAGTEDWALSLNVTNVLNEDPPIYRQFGSTGFTNGSTLGRFVQLGVSMQF